MLGQKSLKASGTNNMTVCWAQKSKMLGKKSLKASGTNKLNVFCHQNQEKSLFVGRGSMSLKTPPTLLIYQRKTPVGGFGGQFRNLHKGNQNTLEVAPLLIPRLTIC